MNRMISSSLSEITNQENKREETWLLAANTKDERNVREWVEHHLLLGFDHILLWNDNSSIFVPERLLSSSSIAKGRVTVRHTHLNKLQYMQRSLHFAKQHHFTYLLYLDLDEYLVLHSNLTSNLTSNPTDTLPKWIERHIKTRAPQWTQIPIPWVMYGSNGHDRLPHPHELLPFYTKCHSFCDRRVKHLIRVDCIECPLSPHHWKRHFPKQEWIQKPNPSFFQGPHLMDVHGNSLPENLPEYTFFTTWTPTSTPLWIAHFNHQCWEEFCRRRSRPRDDTRQRRVYDFALLSSSPPPSSFHQEYNELSLPISSFSSA